MRSQIASVLFITVVAAACGGGANTPQPPAPTTVEPSVAPPIASLPGPTSAATPTTERASTANPTPSASSALGVLEGTWSTPPTTCKQQNDALAKAGFTAKQLVAGGWDTATCSNFSNGSQMTARFAGDRLLIFQDGVGGWDGSAQVVDDDTFVAGDGSTMYITYAYRVDGDRLTVDMLKDTYPGAASAADQLGEDIAQTVVWESVPFTREAGN